MRRWPVILFFLLLGACGGGDDGDAGVASLDDVDAGAVTSTTAARLEPDVALLEFSQCMRDYGIALPDIAVDAEGAPILDPALLDVIDVESDEFGDAFDECQPILSQAGAFDIDIDPELQARIEDQLVGFSQCMRDNGFEDFPDPGPISGPGPVYPLSILAQFDNPEFESTVEVCQQDLAFPGFEG